MQFTTVCFFMILTSFPSGTISIDSSECTSGKINCKDQLIMANDFFGVAIVTGNVCDCYYMGQSQRLNCSDQQCITAIGPDLVCEDCVCHGNCISCGGSLPNNINCVMDVCLGDKLYDSNHKLIELITTYGNVSEGGAFNTIIHEIIYYSSNNTVSCTDWFLSVASSINTDHLCDLNINDLIRLFLMVPESSGFNWFNINKFNCSGITNIIRRDFKLTFRYLSSSDYPRIKEQIYNRNYLFIKVDVMPTGQLVINGTIFYNKTNFKWNFPDSYHEEYVETSSSNMMKGVGLTSLYISFMSMCYFILN